MATEKEIALEQALVVVLGAAKELGLDLDALTSKAKILVMEHSDYRWVEHPHVSNTCQAIDVAKEDVLSKK